MNRQVGFTRKILEVLEQFNISFDHMPSESTISVLLCGAINLKEKKVKC